MLTIKSEKLQDTFRPKLITFLIVCLFLLLYLPFINKAFHIDDPAFISMSQALNWNPLKTVPGDYNYMGRVLSNFSPYESTHPIFIPYFIKFITTLFGQNEIALHLAFSIFPLIAIWSLIRLNGILFFDHQRTSTYIAIFFTTVPAFIVNAQNIMTDVPTLAFLLLAFYCFLYGSENCSRYMLYLGGMAFTLAVFTSYQTVIFIPLLFSYIFWRRRLTMNAGLALALPLFALCSWFIAIYSVYDIFPLLKSNLGGSSSTINDEIERGLTTRNLAGKILYIIAYLGSVTLWIIPFYYFLKKSFTKFIIIFLILMLGCYLVFWNFTEYPAATKLMLALFVACGLQTFATLGFLTRETIREKRNIPQTLFLLVWFLTVIGYNIFLLPFGAARYLLPALPPLIMLIMNAPAWNFLIWQRLVPFVCILCVSLLFALSAAYSDYQYAESYRNFAYETQNIAAVVGASSTFWYIGEWGMRHYMDKVGARVLPATSNEPKIGDFVVIPDMPNFWVPSQLLQQRLVFVTARRYSSAVPIRLFNRRSHAGFYAHLWGILPFAFSKEPDEIFEIYKVIK